MHSPLPIDAVYVLSVRKFQDRIAHMRRELSRNNISFDFIFDFDAADLANSPHLAQFGDTALPLPHKSLVLKHLQAWRLACERAQRRILVFEDDVILHENFIDLLKQSLVAADTLAPGWLLYLGGADAKVPDSFFLERAPLIPLPITTSEGYVTDLAACQKRVAWCVANRITFPADHLIRSIDAKLGIGQYWLPEALVEQGSVTGMFTSALDTHRAKHSQLFNIARNRWSKLRRRTIRRIWARAKHSMFPTKAH
jgi:glycosyl transferase, family 25